MTRNLKALGLALVAVFAMSAIAASAASAQQGTLTSDGPVTLTASEKKPEEGGVNKLTAFGAEVTCPGSTYTAHKVLTQAETEAGKKHEPIPVPATTATLTPHYKQTNHNCVATFGWIATIDMNGCDYVIHLGETTGGVAGTYGVTVDVKCPAGKSITVTLFTTAANETAGTVACILHVGEAGNLGLKGLHATNLAGGTIGLKGTVEGISVSKTKPNNDTILCQAESTTTGKFDLDVIASGKNAAGGTTGIEITDP